MKNKPRVKISAGDIFKSNNYGLMTVVENNTSKAILIEFNDTGNRYLATSSAVIRGLVRDVEYAKKISNERKLKVAVERRRISNNKRVEKDNEFNNFKTEEIGRVFNTKKYGPLAIIEFIDRSFVNVRFHKTGTIVRAGYNSLVNSTDIGIRDPMARILFGFGCIGIGKHKAHKQGGGDSLAFQTWRAMLRRCYYHTNAHNSRPTYKDATVCDEWHNFQVFAA